jgi:hypothetical protein
MEGGASGQKEQATATTTAQYRGLSAAPRIKLRGFGRDDVLMTLFRVF